MRFSCDRTGFPLVEMPEVGLTVGLLPVLKIQFEMYMAGANKYGDDWYEEVLTVSPRASWRHWDEAERESLFMTGVFPKEATAYARWLGGGFRLPTVEEWRRAFGVLDRELCASRAPSGIGKEARHVVSRLWNAAGCEASGELLCGMRGGVYEWADDRGEAVLLGAPRVSVLGDPCEVSIPIDVDRRDGGFGFRVVASRQQA